MGKKSTEVEKKWVKGKMPLVVSGCGHLVATNADGTRRNGWRVDGKKMHRVTVVERETEKTEELEK